VKLRPRPHGRRACFLVLLFNTERAVAVITCEIREVNQEEFEKKAEAFMKLMRGFKSTEDGAFAKKAEKAANIANEYKTEGKKYVAHAIKGSQIYGLVGLMILSVIESYIKVEDICTHPLTSGVGVLLIERAVTVSTDLGKGGTLRLFDASDSTFYDDLGFTVVDGQTKQLVGGNKYR
jgi:hypothetical protein